MRRALALCAGSHTRAADCEDEVTGQCGIAGAGAGADLVTPSLMRRRAHNVALASAFGWLALAIHAGACSASSASPPASSDSGGASSAASSGSGGMGTTSAATTTSGSGGFSVEDCGGSCTATQVCIAGACCDALQACDTAC